MDNENEKASAQEADLTPEEIAELELAQMFVTDRKHVNCPVVGVARLPDQTIDITFQVGHNEFESFRIARNGQKAIAEAYQAGGADLVIADGPLPPMPEPGRGNRPRR